MFDVAPITSLKSNDCGPTCLKMLLAYYGIDVDLDTLIRECNIKLTGCTMGDLRRVGNAHGLDMYPYRESGKDDDGGVKWDGVTKQDRPSIVWWKRTHFCVCCGEDEDGKVVIINPDKGRYRVSLGTFNAFWSNAALFNGEPHDLAQAAEAVEKTEGTEANEKGN